VIPIQGKKIVLIGGAGFIGHNMALHLKSLGADVSIIDGLQVNNMLTFLSSDNKFDNIEMYRSFLNQRIQLINDAKIPLHIQDAREYHALSKVISKIKPDVLIQLAAVAHADRSNKDPYSTFDHSFRTLENALDIARGEKIQHFIYFSSSMVYGNFEGGLVTEKSTCEPLGIYGALKFGGEKLVIAYNQAFDIPYTIVRPSALYGERCVSRRVGQIFIENALAGKEITLSGDGSDRLDFTYVGDVANGIAQIIQHEDSRNQIFNLTYGESRSLEDMAVIVREHFPTINIKYVSKDKLTPDRGTLSVQKAKDLVNYKPSWPLEKGLVQYINWYKSQMNYK